MTKPAKTVVIIPARGGSKGIPRKNVRLLGGKPLLAWSIEAARSVPRVDRVLVSTDDAEIAAVSRQYGAEVIDRPVDISGDKASSESALVHALDWIKHDQKRDPQTVIFLQATSPLRRPDDLRNALDTFRREKADSLFSACMVHGFAWRKAPGLIQPVNYDPVHRPRRQELTEDIIEENGSIYIFKSWVLRRFNSRLGGRIAAYLMDTLDSLQVDEPADFALMERLLAVRDDSSGAEALAGVKLLVLDFDGVMTDNKVLVDQRGLEAVLCHRGDGWGIARLREAGLKVAVLSTEKNQVVAARCRKLKIECVHGCDDKLAMLKEMAGRHGLDRSEVAFVGNDVNDLDCLAWAGVPIAVSDAVPQARAAAKLTTTRPGGDGAVREVADWILASMKPGPVEKSQRLERKKLRSKKPGINKKNVSN